MFVSDAMYHVYCRTSRGEPSFADRVATEGFVEILRQVKRRDGLTVFAWCAMSNHSVAGSWLGPGARNAQALGRYSRQDVEIDVAQVTDEQMQRIVDGEDSVAVLAVGQRAPTARG